VSARDAGTSPGEDEASRERRLAWGIALAALLLLLPGAFFGLPGKPVAGAWRVLGGEVPYRDFWTMYAPGQFYLVAGLFLAFGREVLVQAIATVALRAASAAFVFRLARQFGGSTRASASVALLYALSLFEIAPELGSYPPASLLVLAASSLVLAYLRDGGPARLTRAGLLLGAAALFKHDVAGYAALACALGIAAAWLAAGARRAPCWIPPLAASARIALGALVPVLPAALLLAWKAGPDAWQDLIVFPLTDFPKVRGEQFPGLVPRWEPWQAWLQDPTALEKARAAAGALRTWILARCPEIAFAAGAVFAWRARRTLALGSLAALLFALAGIPFYWSAAHVQQNTHFTSMAVLALLTGVLLWRHAGRGARAGLAAGALAYAAGLLIAPFEQVWLPARVWSRPEGLGLPAASAILVSPREREVYARIGALVRANVPALEAIHAGVWRHDTIVISNPRFYYLCDRRPATRYHELHPGITDREDVQREMIADLERERVRCAVLWRFGWPEDFLEELLRRRMARVPGTGSKLLDSYFRERFHPVLEVGEYVVLWRNDAPAPVLP